MDAKWYKSGSDNMYLLRENRIGVDNVVARMKLKSWKKSLKTGKASPSIEALRAAILSPLTTKQTEGFNRWFKSRNL